MFQICFRLFLGREILTQRPHVGGGIFHTEFIQICTIFGVDFDKKQHIHQILQFSKPNLLVRGRAKSIGFTVNLLRMCVTMCFALPASSFPRLPVRSAFLCGSHHVFECLNPRMIGRIRRGTLGNTSCTAHTSLSSHVVRAACSRGFIQNQLRVCKVQVAATIL